MNIRKKTILLCSFMFSFLSIFAQDLDTKKMSFQGYSGGMMFHTGYLSGGEINIYNSHENINIQGFPWGMGGLLRFHFGKHLRIGGEGHSSNLHFGKNKSFLSLGWGGFLIDCQWKINKFTLFCGGTIGGGNVKNITIVNNFSNDSKIENALYRKYAIMLIDPFIGVEYAVSNKISLITKVDYIVNLTQKQSDFPIGTRIYAGIIFFHAKNSKKQLKN